MYSNLVHCQRLRSNHLAQGLATYAAWAGSDLQSCAFGGRELSLHCISRGPGVIAEESPFYAMFQGTTWGCGGVRLSHTMLQVSNGEKQ